MKSIAGPVRRVAAWICLGIAVVAGALPAAAAPLSDVWFNRNEQGWGMNTIEQRGTLFITLFVYGPDGRPIWYVASDATLVSGTNRFTGPLYVTNGPYFGGNFAGAVGVRQVGTITFTVNSNVYSGTVAYSVDGVTVNKTVERQSWKSLSPSGTFFGGIDTSSGCTINGLSANPDTVTIVVSLVGNNLTMTMTGANAGTLTLTASVTQYGSVYYGPATMRIGTVNYPGTIFDFAVDDDGISGNIGIGAPSGCTVQARFVGLRPRS